MFREVLELAILNDPPDQSEWSNARSTSTQMRTFLLTWNPAQWNGEITSPMRWSCGNTKSIRKGDRLFLLRQGEEPRGVCGAGWAASDVLEETAPDSQFRLYVNFQIDVFRDPAAYLPLNSEALQQLNAGLAEQMRWVGVRSSGTEIPTEVAARLEVAWEQLCGPRLFPDEVSATIRLMEGTRSTIQVNAYERNPWARRLCLAAHGTTCCVCAFDFGAVYGPAAEGFIHVHHLRPLSEIAEEYQVDPVNDLRPVCPNCHAVIHRRTPPYSIEEVRAMLAAQAGGSS